MMIIKPLTAECLQDALQIMERTHPWPWTSATFALFFKKNFRMIGAYQEHLCGFYVTQKIADESHLLMICVDPKSQRKGIARQMMRDYLAHDKAQGCQHFFLEVRESNFSAQNLYTEFGFHVYSQRKDYYQHQEYKEDALLMCHDLSPNP